MSFIQIAFLTALAALAVPIIIHLVFRQRAKKVDLGTLRFLRIVLEHNARRRRVMRWLLLSLRLACVALLAFLFARPYLLSARSAGEKRTVAVLVDRSATMELAQDGVRAVDRAVASVKQLLNEAPENTRFEIAWFDHQVEPLFSPVAGDNDKARSREPSRVEQLARLQAPEACYGGTDYGAAMEWARDVLAKAPPGPRVLHVFTDFQQSGLAWSEVDELPEDVASHLHDFGRPAVNNLAVTEARPERPWLRPDEQTSLHLTVYNGGPFAAIDLPVVLRLANAGREVSLREQLRVEPGTAESLRLDLPPLAAGLWQGTLAIEAEDDLPADNVRHVAILASRPYQVLLIDGRASPSPVLSSTYFLESALRLAPEGELYSASPFEPRQIVAGDPLPSLDQYDVVVLSDVGDELDRRDAEQLASLVERGGGLLVFCGENVTAERTAVLAGAGLTAGQIGGIEYATDLPLRLATWNSKHPIFAAFSDPQLGDLARLSFSAATKIVPAKGTQVLARYKSGTPAVLETTLGQGSIVWFASTADRRWSDWTRSRLYLPLVYQLLGHQSGLTAGGRVREEILEAHAESAAPRRAPAAAPGVHAQQAHTLIVNTSPREAETDRTTLEEFADRFGLKLAAETAPAEVAQPQRAAAGTELIQGELWPWLAACLLAALLAEGLVANRTAG